MPNRNEKKLSGFGYGSGHHGRQTWQRAITDRPGNISCHPFHGQAHRYEIYQSCSSPTLQSANQIMFAFYYIPYHQHESPITNPHVHHVGINHRASKHSSRPTLLNSNTGPPIWFHRPSFLRRRALPDRRSYLHVG